MKMKDYFLYQLPPIDFWTGWKDMKEFLRVEDNILWHVEDPDDFDKIVVRNILDSLSVLLEALEFGNSVGADTEVKEKHFFFSGLPADNMGYSEVMCAWKAANNGLRMLFPLPASLARLEMHHGTFQPKRKFIPEFGWSESKALALSLLRKLQYTVLCRISHEEFILSRCQRQPGNHRNLLFRYGAGRPRAVFPCPGTAVPPGC
jgi:hypothetical protein